MPSRFTHVVANSKTSFLINEYIFVLCIYIHILFIYSSFSGHLDCFNVLVMINNVSMNMRIQVSLPDTDFFSFGKCPELELLGPVLALFL